MPTVARQTASMTVTPCARAVRPAAGSEGAAADSLGENAERRGSDLGMCAASPTAGACAVGPARRTPNSDGRIDRAKNWRIGGPRLPQAADQHGPDSVGYGFRQASPQRDERAVFRVRRVVLRHVVASQQLVFVTQRRRLEAPVLLEAERARPALASTIIEDSYAP